MSHTVKLTVFFAISVALHGAGLWAAAGRFEARQPEPSAGVAIVDRDLFFRHAPRSETQASYPVSVTERLVPRSGRAVQPSQPAEAMSRVRADTASEPEPEHRAPESPAVAVARLDVPTVEAAPAPRRQAAALQGIEAERRAPVRMSGVGASAPPAALLPQVQRSAPAPVRPRTSEPVRPLTSEPVRPRTSEPVRPRTSYAEIRASPAIQASLVIGRPLQPASDARHVASTRAAEPVSAPASRRRPLPAEPLTRTSAEPAERGTIDTMATVKAEPAERATLDAMSAARAESAPAGEPARTIAPAADAAAAPAPRRRETLRGTLPAPLLAPHEAESTQPVDAPLLAPTQDDRVRLRASLPGEPDPDRTNQAAVLRPTAPTADRSAARALQPAPSRSHSAPGTSDLAALAPDTAARRLESADPPSGARDPVDRFTRAYHGGECFYPLRLVSRDGADIRGYGVQTESLEMFRQAFAQALGIQPDVDWRPLTDAQCGGISFARLMLGDSAPSLHVGLEHKTLDYGVELAGRVTGNRFDFVTLLVVDDSGVVHNVLEYLRPDGDELAFSVPVHPVGDGTDRVQLIMAVGASEPLPVLASTTPVHSDDFFPKLLDQTGEAGAVLELGLQDFVIRDGP